MNHTTDTPRTDAASFSSRGPLELMKTSQQLERELAEIRSALGDDGRRTHKEVVELATKASQWREWKEKYIDLKNSYIAEGQDPAGTIWEHADKLQKQLTRAVEIAEMFQRGNSGLHYQCNCAMCQLLGDLKGELK